MDATIEFPDGEAPLPPELDPEGDGFVYGQSIPYAIDWLDEQAVAAGAKSFRAFASDVDAGEDEDEDFTGEAAGWHDVVDGLKSVEAAQASLSALAERAVSPDGLDVEISDLKWDLDAYERILRGAMGSQQKFRLMVG